MSAEQDLDCRIKSDKGETKNQGCQRALSARAG